MPGLLEALVAGGGAVKGPLAGPAQVSVPRGPAPSPVAGSLGWLKTASLTAPVTPHCVGSEAQALAPQIPTVGPPPSLSPFLCLFLPQPGAGAEQVAEVTLHGLLASGAAFVCVPAGTKHTADGKQVQLPSQDRKGLDLLEDPPSCYLRVPLGPWLPRLLPAWQPASP